MRLKISLSIVIILTVVTSVIYYSNIFASGISTISFGSTYSGNSQIDGKLNYSFNIKKGNINDKINQIYFQGDTICFAFTVYGIDEETPVKVSFINPKNREQFPAERLDRVGNRFRGFSLVGTILEEFKIKNLNSTWINYKIKVEVENKNIQTKTTNIKKFKIDISYID